MLGKSLLVLIALSACANAQIIKCRRLQSYSAPVAMTPIYSEPALWQGTVAGQIVVLPGTQYKQAMSGPLYYSRSFGVQRYRMRCGPNGCK